MKYISDVGSDKELIKDRFTQKLPLVNIIVCGRFHYHKYIKLLCKHGSLNRFIYSYRRNFKLYIDKKFLENFYAKEYLMYLGKKILPSRLFYSYLSYLHNLWQAQVLTIKPGGNIAHFLLHGNCDKIMKVYKKAGIKIVGEAVNVHPVIQNELLQNEYQKYGCVYESGEKYSEKKIINEYNLCDYFLAPSIFIKNSLIAQGIDSTKIKVIPYGLNKPRGLIKDNTVIKKGSKIKLLFVGQLTFRKGVIYLCEAFDLLKEDGYNCELTLVGKIDPFYHKIIYHYLKKDQVIHISHIDNSEIEKVMIEHDLLVMPSIEDGFGIVVSEALSIHLPVIVTSNCGASEIVTNGEDGFIVEPFFASAIANAIIKSVEYNFMFSNAVFTWDDYVNRLDKFYASILN